MSKEDKIKKIKLLSQYSILSEIEELWGAKPSKHRAYVFVDKKMREIIKQLQTLEDK